MRQAEIIKGYAYIARVGGTLTVVRVIDIRKRRARRAYTEFHFENLCSGYAGVAYNAAKFRREATFDEVAQCRIYRNRKGPRPYFK